MHRREAVAVPRMGPTCHIISSHNEILIHVNLSKLSLSSQNREKVLREGDTICLMVHDMQHMPLRLRIYRVSSADLLSAVRTSTNPKAKTLMLSIVDCQALSESLRRLYTRNILESSATVVSNSHVLLDTFCDSHMLFAKVTV